MSSSRKRQRRTEWWIAKVPEFVLQHFDSAAAAAAASAAGSGTSGGFKGRRPVAQLLPVPDQAASDAAGPPAKMRMRLLEPDATATATATAADAASQAPKELEFVVRNEYLSQSTIVPPSMFVISDSKNTDECAVEAKVALFADVRPSRLVYLPQSASASIPSATEPVASCSAEALTATTSYDQLLGSRSERYAATKQTERMEMTSKHGHRIMTASYVQDRSAGMLYKRPTVRRVDRSADRRVRMDERALRNRLFNLFDEKPYYRLNELVKLTDQPKAFLKEVLASVCQQHRAGPHMHHYSLKANFKLTTDEPDEEEEDVDDED